MIKTKTQPKPKFEIAITKTSEGLRFVFFDCVSSDAFSGIEKYGFIDDYTNVGGGYVLTVNGCYDFQEVIDCILANGGGYAK